MIKAAIFVFPLIFSTIMTGCSNSGSKPSSTLSAPSYATMALDGWEVRCGSTEIFVSQYRIKQYYEKDGSAKTHPVFCNGESTGSHIIDKNKN